MTGLRDALEKLADHWDALDCSRAVGWSEQTKEQVTENARMCAGDLRALLEDHPGVGDEAVERVAASMFEAVHELDWSQAEGVVRDQWLSRARAALEAAAPLLGPRSGVDSSLHICPGCGVKVVGHERCGDPTRPECGVMTRVG